MSETRIGRPYGIGLFWFVTLLVGCVGFGPGRDVVWRFDDPPGLSPYAQPLGAAPGGATQQSVGRPDARTPRRALSAPEPGTPGTPAAPSPQTSPNLPALQLDVAVPPSVAVDDLVPLRLAVKNRSPLAAENVTTTVRFNDAWQFSGSDQRNIEEQLGRITPGAQRELTVSLYARRPGNHTLEVVVHSETHEEAARTVSIDIAPRTVDVQIVGPDERTVGSRAEYVLTLTNVSGESLPATRVDVAYDDALLLKEVSAGVERTPGRLTWDLGELLQDERVQIQVEFECTTAAVARLRVDVSGTHFGLQRREVPLQIAARSEIDLQISDAADPISVGESTTYTVRVTNGGKAPHRGVTLHLTPTEQLQIVSVQARTGSGERAIVSDQRAEGWTVATAQELPPAGVLTYDVQVQARSIGVGQLMAVLRSEGLLAPLQARELTVVDPPVVRQP